MILIALPWDWKSWILLSELVYNNQDKYQVNAILSGDQAINDDGQNDTFADNQSLEVV